MSIDKIFDIENWDKVTLEYISNSLQNKDDSLIINGWRNHNKDLSPISLYKLLKSKFGIPNGMTMLFKKESTDNLIHWHYTFSVDENEIHFFGKSSGIEILLKTKPEIKFAENEWKKLIANIKSSYSKYGKQMKEVQADFQKYTLFINPFTRLFDTLKKQVIELKDLDITEIEKINPHTASEDESKEYYKKLNQWIINIEKATALGTTIRMLSPVLAESFINTLLLVLAKEDYKKDKRLYENLIRQQIDIRVKTLHLNCNGFIKQINGEAQEFKDFHILMNNRNDFLHGNIDPTRLMFEEVYFDMEFIPLFKEDDGIISKTMKNYLKNVEAEKAFNDYSIVQKFIRFVLSHLDEQNKGHISHLLSTRMPGYNNKTNGIAILFPSRLAEI